MYLYIAVAIVILIASLCSKELYMVKTGTLNIESFNKKNRDINFLLIAFLIILVFSLRGKNVGTDTETYLKIYQEFDCDFKNIKNAREPVFWILCFVLKCLKLPFPALLIIVSVFTCIVFFKILKKYSVMPYISIYLFVCLGIYAMSFNGLRQFIALCFFILGLDCAYSNKKLKYVLFCCLAYLTHNSAIVLFPIILIKYIKINWQFVLITFICCILSIFAMPYLIQIVSKFTGRDYYEFYYKSKMFISTPDFYNICYLLGMIAIFVFLWYTKRNIKDKKEKSIFNFFLIIFYISVCLRFIATFSSSFMLVNRFGAYFFWALIVLIPYSIKYFFKQNLVYLYSALVYIFAAIYFIISVKVRKSNGIYSYYLLTRSILASSSSISSSCSLIFVQNSFTSAGSSASAPNCS